MADDTGARLIASQLDAAVRNLPREVAHITDVACAKTKKTMRADMSGSDYFKKVARSIGYDLIVTPGYVEGEVGPNTAGATVGDLAHIAYFGGARGGGGTVRDPEEALQEEAPHYQRELDKLMGRLL
jgi:hypothetical protein